MERRLNVTIRTGYDFLSSLLDHIYQRPFGRRAPTVLGGTCRPREEHRIECVMVANLGRDKMVDIELLQVDIPNKLDDSFAQPLVMVKMIDNSKPRMRYWGENIIAPEDPSADALADTVENNVKPSKSA